MSNWPKKKLGEVATFINGRAFKSTDWKRIGFPIIRIQNLNNPTSEYNYFDGMPDERNIVHHGAILISWSASLGVYRWQGPIAVLNQHIFKVVPDVQIIDRDFFFWLAKSLLEIMKRKMHGGTMKHITKSAFENISFPLPPLAEQKRIVEILDEADRLRQLRKQANDRMAAFLPALFLEMFGDPQTNPKGWPVVTLGEIGGTGQYGLNAAATRENDGVRFIRITDIDDAGHLGRAEPAYVSHAIADTEKYALQPGDILIARSGATAGKSYMHRALPEKAVFAGYLIRFCLDRTRVLPIFVASFLQTTDYWRQLRSYKRAVAQPNVNAKQLGALRIPLPSLALQQKFGSLATDAEAEMQKQSRATVRLENLFQSLLAQAFSGGGVQIPEARPL